MLSPTPRTMSDLPPTRQSLLIELGRRSEAAWEEFLEVYETVIRRVCRSRGLQEADARDVCQEVLSAVHQRIATWDPDASAGTFRGWLVRVARNVSVDVIRRRGRAEVGSGDSEVERSLREIVDPRAEEDDFDLEVRRSAFEWAASKARSEVREATWEAFRLTALQGIAADEAAQRLGVPVGSVYTAKCRVIARIRARALEFEAQDEPSKGR